MYSIQLERYGYLYIFRLLTTIEDLNWAYHVNIAASQLLIYQA